MRYVPLAVAVAVLALSSTTRGADTSGAYHFWGAASITCKAYSEMAEAQNADFEKTAFWMAGYITAYNRLTDKTYDIVEKDGNISATMLWLLHYCKEHGGDTLNKAAETFTIEHMAKRQITHP